MKNLMIVGLLGLSIGFIGGYKYSKKPVQTTISIKVDTLKIPFLVSKGVERKVDTLWIKDTVKILDSSPCCIPYATFREDSILQIFIASYPYEQKNEDSVFVKPRFVLFHDTVTVNTSTTVSFLHWYYIPLAALTGYLYGHTK